MPLQDSSDRMFGSVFEEKGKKMAQWKIGDVVILKSGGPAMTVSDVGDYSPMGPNPGVRCVWFDNTKKVEDLFHAEVVELFDLNG